MICKKCKKATLLAKFYPSSNGTGWFTRNDEGVDLNDFFEQHHHLYDEESLDALAHGGNQYEIKYTMDDDYPKQWQFED